MRVVEPPMEWCAFHDKPMEVCRQLLARRELRVGSCVPVGGRFVPDDPGPTIADLARDRRKARD